MAEKQKKTDINKLRSNSLFEVEVIRIADNKLVGVYRSEKGLYEHTYPEDVIIKKLPHKDFKELLTSH